LSSLMFAPCGSPIWFTSCTRSNPFFCAMWFVHLIHSIYMIQFICVMWFAHLVSY
jgi:hypothetical protein